MLREISQSFQRAVAALPADLRPRASDLTSSRPAGGEWQLRDANGVILNPAAPAPEKRYNVGGAASMAALHAMADAYGKAFQRIHERIDLIEEVAIALDARTAPHGAKSMKPRLRYTPVGWQPRAVESAGAALDRLGVSRVTQDANGDWQAA